MTDQVSALKKTKLADQKQSKRRSSDDISKYEKPLPYHLDDFMNVYLAAKANESEPKEDLIVEMATTVQQMIREHWVTSSKTRMAFQAMEKEVAFEEIAEKTMRLTKRNLATLDSKFIPELDEYCKTTYADLIEDMRVKIRAIMVALYATDEEIAGTESEIGNLGEVPVAYQHANLAVHRDILGRYLAEIKAKFPLIEFARQRELFIMHLVNWEASHKDQHKVQAKGKEDMMNWIAKFRISAITTIIASNKQLSQMVTAYEAETGNTFEMMGKRYTENFFDKQVAQIAKVKTNFSYFTLKILYFDNPRGGADCNIIVQKVLDPVIEECSREVGALDIPDPMEMPVFAAEVGFLFEYY